jgi:hypothetical protein
MKVEFIDNSASQYDENADRIKIPFKSKSKLGRMFLGDSYSASFLQLKWRNCKNVVNCSKEIHGFARETDVNYLKIDPDDEDTNNLFEDSYVFIDSVLEKGKNVLVHCDNGINKSAAIVLYYLMKKSDKSLGESYKLLKTQRKKDIKIRPQILQQLISAEKRLRGTISIMLDGRKIVFLDSLKTSKAGSPLSPLLILFGVVVFFAAIFLGIFLLTGKL